MLVNLGSASPDWNQSNWARCWGIKEADEMGGQLGQWPLAHIVPKVRKNRTAETCLKPPYLAAW